MTLKETRRNVDKWLKRAPADDPWRNTMMAARLHLMRHSEMAERIAAARDAREALERMADVAQNITRV